uniref:Regulatory protein RecX n=1 Tax=uncultured Microgenomates bacterium Rifle_16ft_4_minimus_38077 TaxID=1665117 RepID=A0A0H4T6Q2_9BACT|nr:regulatory protein RecX [uncultured Microgenomates bacterium Rifle_16ft_4_minimus_38077]
MPSITSIKPQKSKKRVNIYLDDKFGFGLDLENFMKLGLRVEQELSDKEIKIILKKAEFQKASDKLLRYATLRPRSEKEFRNWLKKHKVHESLHRELFDRLKRLELIDDKVFAKWWIGQRLQFKFKSKRELENELQIKGIDRNITEDVLSEVNIDEVKIAKGLLNKKKYRWEKLPKHEAREKMSEFLGRKGFGWGIIKIIIDDVLEKD